MAARRAVAARVAAVTVVAAALVAVAAATTGEAPDLVASPSPSPVALDPGDGDWLAALNAYRASAVLPAAVAEPSWVAGAEAHARYMVRNGWIGHDEEPDRSGYSRAGAEAAESGHLLADQERQAPREAVEAWMAAPFHALGLLHPQLVRAAYGDHHDLDAGRWSWAATLDVTRGLDPTIPPPATTTVWPGEGAAVPLTSYRTEWPDALGPCEGYGPGAGLPLVVRFAARDTRLVSAGLRDDSGRELEVCAYDADGYSDPSEEAAETGRTLLAEHRAAIVVPRAELEVGRTYTATVVASDGTRLTWSFAVTDGTIRAAGGQSTSRTGEG